jgi:hypothetical protein
MTELKLQAFDNGIIRETVGGAYIGILTIPAQGPA